MRFRVLAAAIAVAAVIGAAGPATAATTTGPGTGTGTAATGVTVSGAHLLEDGTPWTPRGVQIVGLVAPDDLLWGKYVAAHAAFGAGELSQARADGADLIRFQVSQFALDPLGSYYSAAYLQEVIDAVRMARSLGLAVIVSMQAELPTGLTFRCPLPDGQTERAWAGLAPIFAGDPGVMFELYNEPGLSQSAANWQTWLTGGPVIDPSGVGCSAVGMQQLIDAIRAEHADNVLIVPGLNYETTLAGMPALTDPASPSDPQLAYGVHYPLPWGGIPVWKAAFGRRSGQVPVIVTEWDENSTTSCYPNSPAQSALLLDYLAVKQIGVVGFAFDLPGTIVSDYATYAPTSYAGFACGVPGGGPGQLLFSEYAAMAAAAPDGEGSAVPAWVISGGALAQLVASDPATTSHFFNTPRTFVTGATATSLASVPAAIRAASFKSETALASAVLSGSLAPSARAVVLDLEHSARTPVAEQRRPGAYFHLAAQVAHQHGLLLVADPATSIVPARSPATAPSDQYARFERMRIAAKAARYADVYEIDARGSDTSGPAYAGFVRTASAQATAAAPDVTLIATLSSGPHHPALRSPANILRAALATRTVVSGYQLNDLRPGGGCRSCALSPVEMADAFLRDYEDAGG